MNDYEAELSVEFIGLSGRLEDLRDDIQKLIDDKYKEIEVKGL